MSTERLYSIGYASKPIQEFLAQLQQYDIDVVADVRSVPYSKRFYDYHREALATRLKEAGVRYVFLGEELGPRSKDDAHYDKQGQVQFDRLMQSPLYLSGIQRLQTGLDKGMRIALLCAEKDPSHCHRSLLIGYHLQRQLDISVQHITHTGELESQTAMETRLISMHSIDGDLFSSAEEQAELAWQSQSRLKAYRRPLDRKP